MGLRMGVTERDQENGEYTDMAREALMEHENATAAPEDEFMGEVVEEIMIEDLTVDGICGVY
jgi:mycofactocin precursor